MKVKATKTKGINLKPGDLFSTAGPEYWDHIDVMGGVGEKVYIRTNSNAMDTDDWDEEIYKIEIVKDVCMGCMKDESRQWSDPKDHTCGKEKEN